MEVNDGTSTISALRIVEHINEVINVLSLAKEMIFKEIGNTKVATKMMRSR